MGETRFCGFCGAARLANLLPALQPADEAQSRCFCNYCWSLLEVGFRSLWPDDDPACLSEVVESRLTASELDACIAEGVLQRARAACWQDR